VVELEYALARAEQIRDEARAKANAFMAQRDRALVLLRQRVDAEVLGSSPMTLTVWVPVTGMTVELSPEQHARMVELIENPPQASAALIALMRGEKEP
jgi:hypothetical protein